MFFKKSIMLVALLTGAVVTAQTGVAHAQAPGAWEYVGTTEGVKVWRRSVPGTALLQFRGETTVPVHIGKVLAVFLDRNQRKFWVDRYDDSKMLEQPNPMSEIYWIKFKLPFPISNRDYVLRADAVVNAANHSLKASIKSVRDARKADDDCCVRAHLQQTYYLFEAVKGKEMTKMTVEVQTDPKGMLPDWLINSIQKNWPSKTLSALANRAAKWHKPREEFTNWHD